MFASTLRTSTRKPLPAVRQPPLLNTIPVYRVVLDKLKVYLQDQISAILGRYRHTTWIRNSVCCIFVNRFLFLTNFFLLYGAVLTETMGQKTKYLDCKKKVFRMVGFSKYRGSRDYFQFFFVCEDFVCFKDWRQTVGRTSLDASKL